MLELHLRGFSDDDYRTALQSGLARLRSAVAMAQGSLIATAGRPFAHALLQDVEELAAVVTATSEKRRSQVAADMFVRRQILSTIHRRLGIWLASDKAITTKVVGKGHAGGYTDA